MRVASMMHPERDRRHDEVPTRGRRGTTTDMGILILILVVLAIIALILFIARRTRV